MKWLMIILLLSISTYAIDINSSILSNQNLNDTIIINKTIYCNELIIENDSISINYYTINSSPSTLISNINITSSNLSITVNDTNINIIRLSDITESSIIISKEISDQVNTTAYLKSLCNPIYDGQTYTIKSNNSAEISTYTCSSGQLIIDILNVPLGDTLIYIEPNRYSLASEHNPFNKAFIFFSAIGGLITIVSIIFMIKLFTEKRITALEMSIYISLIIITAYIIGIVISMTT